MKLSARLFFFCAILTAFAFNPLATQIVFGQDEDAGEETYQEDPKEEMTEHSRGTIVSISENEVVIEKEAGEDGLAPQEVYTINPETELKNAASVEEISSGQSVDVEYADEDGKLLAKTITVE